MARVICFLDTIELAAQVRHSLDGDYNVHILTASHLTRQVRDTVRAIEPAVILLELNSALDNAHMYFFLRSDEATRHMPIVILSETPCVDQRLAMFCKDGCVQYNSIDQELYRTINQHAPLARAVGRAA